MCRLLKDPLVPVGHQPGLKGFGKISGRIIEKAPKKIEFFEFSYF
jgi:hypothetical protein